MEHQQQRCATTPLNKCTECCRAGPCATSKRATPPAINCWLSTLQMQWVVALQRKIKILELFWGLQRGCPGDATRTAQAAVLLRGIHVAAGAARRARAQLLPPVRPWVHRAAASAAAGKRAEKDLLVFYFSGTCGRKMWGERLLGMGRCRKEGDSWSGIKLLPKGTLPGR